jgi:hypothetical protein
MSKKQQAATSARKGALKQTYKLTLLKILLLLLLFWYVSEGATVADLDVML